MLTLLITLSTIMWYLIDRAKSLWEGKPWSKYVTIAVSAVFAFGLTFSFGLDLIYSLGLVEYTSIAGSIMTGFTLMSGSSAVA